MSVVEKIKTTHSTYPFGKCLSHSSPFLSLFAFVNSISKPSFAFNKLSLDLPGFQFPSWCILCGFLARRDMLANKSAHEKDSKLNLTLHSYVAALITVFNSLLKFGKINERRDQNNIRAP